MNLALCIVLYASANTACCPSSPVVHPSLSFRSTKPQHKQIAFTCSWQQMISYRMLLCNVAFAPSRCANQESSLSVASSHYDDVSAETRFDAEQHRREGYEDRLECPRPNMCNIMT